MDPVLGPRSSVRPSSLSSLGRRRRIPRPLAATASLLLSAASLPPQPAPAQAADHVVPDQLGGMLRRVEMRAMSDTGGGALDTLVALALVRSPAVRAAAARAAAARARVGPAGLLPDPTLMAGVQNFPVSEPGFSDEMTMKMIGVGQTLPYPGKRSLRRQAAARDADVEQVGADAVQRQIVRDVKAAYYELAFLDQALAIVARNTDVLADGIRLTEGRYAANAAGAPGGGLSDVLRARAEAARLADQAVALTEQRRAALARLNAALDRPSDTPVPKPTIPAGVTHAAVADSARDVHFTAVALGARAADSPLPPVEALQAIAVRESPVLREHATRVAAQGARVELARRDYLPDVDVSLQYGQRQGRADMVTAVFSVPLPVQRARRQDPLVAAARADLAAAESERRARENEVRAEIARLVSELERQRTRLALYKRAILPQGQASLTSAVAGYQVGRIEFRALLDSQATLFGYETEYFRALSDFATNLAELERVVGVEVLR